MTKHFEVKIQLEVYDAMDEAVLEHYLTCGIHAGPVSLLVQEINAVEVDADPADELARGIRRR